MTLPELLALVGADNMNFQLMTTAMTNIKRNKRCSVVTFETDAIGPANVIDNSGPVGLVVWCDREAWEAAMQKMNSAPAPNGAAANPASVQREKDGGSDE